MVNNFVLAADENLETFVLSTNRPNAISLISKGKSQVIYLYDFTDIVCILYLRNGLYLLVVKDASNNCKLLILNNKGETKDITPLNLPIWVEPIRIIYKNNQSHLIMKGSNEPLGTAPLYIANLDEFPYLCQPCDSTIVDALDYIFLSDGTLLAYLEWDKQGNKYIKLPFNSYHRDYLLKVPSTDRLQLIASAGSDSIYIINDTKQEAACIFKLSLTDGKMSLVASADRADITMPFISPTGELLGYCSQWGYSSYKSIVDCPLINEARTCIPQEAEMIPQQVSLNNKRLLFHYYLPGRPPCPAVYEKGKGVMELATLVNLPETFQTYFSEYAAQDGTVIPVYYTTPKGRGPFPTVVFVHGGPRARTDARYDWRVQYLVYCGFAVVQPQFRGSRGWGKKFMHAGNRQWGKGVMQTDVIDCIPWLIKQGISEPHRIAVFGGSYGGYAVTASLCFYPGRFACGISLFGPQDLLLYMQKMNGVDSPYSGEDSLIVGDLSITEEQERLISISPVYHTKNIKEPLLIYYGEKDTLVPPEHSKKLISALKAEGKTVVEVALKDEAHGFINPEHETWLYAKIIVPFLNKHLSKYECK